MGQAEGGQGGGGELGSLHCLHAPWHLSNLTLSLTHCKQI